MVVTHRVCRDTNRFYRNVYRRVYGYYPQISDSNETENGE